MHITAKNNIFALIITALLCIYLYCINSTSAPTPTPNSLPQPITPKTNLKENMEDPTNKHIKHDWFELMHRSADQVDWRKVEAKTMFSKYREKVHSVNGKSNKVSVAGGKLTGEWFEKGANNQAGDIKRIAYSKSQDKLYAISAGHTLWRGNTDGTSWEVVSDLLRFDYDVLEIVEDGDEFGIIANINEVPYYSDGGMLWSVAEGVEDFASTKKTIKLANNKVFVLGKDESNGLVKLFKSETMGKTYEEMATFQTTDLSMVAICASPNQANLYAIEHLPGAKSVTYLWNDFSNVLAQIGTNFGWDVPEEANLHIGNDNGQIIMYRNGSNKLLFRSENLGSMWMALPDLPEKPWWDAFYVDEDNPYLLMFGRVQCYYSENGGYTWKEVNKWEEYYDDPVSKLHADIMQIKKFKKNNNKEYIALSNHGGISIADNVKDTPQNITLQGMKNAQYYDVISHPTDPRWIFTGSQDQGWQRGRDYESVDGAEQFEQILSGDWGHLTFNREEGLWLAFPGGEIHYYKNPLTASEGSKPTKVYTFDNYQQSVWIPPMMLHPDPAFGNTIYVAGGSVNPGFGSYLIQLKVGNNNQLEDTQKPFNFAVSNGEISAISHDPLDITRWYVATSNGKFFYSEDSGDNFEMVTPDVPFANDRYGSFILGSKVTPKTVYVAGSGYSAPPVIKSLDGGISFEDFSNGLPSTTVFELAANENESLIFAATEAGPYVYIRSTEKWHDLSGFMAPNQRYWSVEYIEEMKLARFGTYGRGVWDFEIDEFVNNKELAEIAEEINIYPNPTSDHLTIQSDIFGNIFHFDVFSTDGNFIFGGEISSPEELKISVADLPTGSYLIRFKNERKHIFKKFVKI